MNSIVLMIAGKAHSGKDQFYQFISKYTPSIKLPFADEVRKELCRLHPEIDYNRLCNDNDYKSQFRKELIVVGDGYRDDDPDIWTNKHEIALIPNLHIPLIAVPDARYRNELVDYPRTLNRKYKVLPIKVKIKASIPTCLSRMSDKGMKTYIENGLYNRSENDLNDIPDSFYDVIIDNDRNLNTISDINYNFVKQSESLIDIILKTKALM